MREAIEAATSANGAGTAGKVEALVERTRDGFFKAMDDDLNTRDAVYRLQQMTEAVAELRTISVPRAAPSSTCTEIAGGSSGSSRTCAESVWRLVAASMAS